MAEPHLCDTKDFHISRPGLRRPRTTPAWAETMAGIITVAKGDVVRPCGD